MEKNFLSSKTFWASVLIALGIVGNYMAGNIDISMMLTGIGGAFGLFGLRSAIK